jgi:hypothetical protein
MSGTVQVELQKTDATCVTQSHRGLKLPYSSRFNQRDPPLMLNPRPMLNVKLQQLDSKRAVAHNHYGSAVAQAMKHDLVRGQGRQNEYRHPDGYKLQPYL